MPARASAKRVRCQCVFHESYSRARCSARARIRAPSASVYVRYAKRMFQVNLLQQEGLADNVRQKLFQS